MLRRMIAVGLLFLSLSVVPVRAGVARVGAKGVKAVSKVGAKGVKVVAKAAYRVAY